MRNDPAAEYTETTTIFGEKNLTYHYPQRELETNSIMIVQRMQFYAIEIAR